MKARFEDWVKKYHRTYPDEEERAMRFNVFKDNIKSFESQGLLPNCFADLKDEELPSRRSCIADIDQDIEECLQAKILAETGEFTWTPDVMQGHKKATQVSA
ncbi:senescence-specific cysteine protease SAG39-like [Lolium rigidum]|nr:senescence-specific cysteine protease SAG39-like [Lolium rigidum]